MSNDNNKTMERRDGATPNGGDYSEAYYKDENMHPCDKKNAKYVEILEIKSSGQIVQTTLLERRPVSD